MNIRIRFTKVDEFQLLTCVKHNLWGSKTNRFTEWKEGDFLAFIVDKQIAALAEISGNAFQSDKEIWKNGLFPYRIPIQVKMFFSNENRLPILGKIRDVITNIWSPNYGLSILSQRLMEGENAEIIVNEIKSKNGENEINYVLKNIDALLDKFFQDRSPLTPDLTIEKRKLGRPQKAHQDIITRQPEIMRSYKKTIVNDTNNAINLQEEPSAKQEESLHSKAQYLLSKFAQILGYQNFIASNDRKRKFNNIELGTLTLQKFPNLPLGKDITDKIALIDVIWLERNAARCAFEVETSTSIYSGLLRMSDLLTVIPNLNIKLYIVAQEERKEKVLKELGRPTFRKIGLNDYCQFISIEALDDLLKTVEPLAGHLQPSILNKIAIGLPEEDEETEL